MFVVCLLVGNWDRTSVEGKILTILIPQDFVEVLIVRITEPNHCCATDKLKKKSLRIIMNLKRNENSKLRDLPW